MANSHANCTHEATKAARAACRAGRLGDASAPVEAKTAARDRLRAKASHAAVKFGSARAEGEPIKKSVYVSGHCSISNHDRCTGVYAHVDCTCSCHAEVA